MKKRADMKQKSKTLYTIYLPAYSAKGGLLR
jgi:hypothetical protein